VGRGLWAVGLTLDDRERKVRRPLVCSRPLGGLWFVHLWVKTPEEKKNLTAPATFHFWEVFYFQKKNSGTLLLKSYTHNFYI
jgi:hypothetical protein